MHRHFGDLGKRLVIAGLPAGLLLAGCTQAASAATTLTVVLSSWNLQNEYGWQQTIDLFEKLNPDIHVETIVASGGVNELVQKQSVVVAAGEPVDVLALHSATRGDSIYGGLVQPLDQLAAAAGINLADYPQGVIAQFEADGHLYGIPFNGAPHAIAYNAQLLDAAGLAHPAQSWSWSDLEQLAQKSVKISADGKVEVSGLSGPWTDPYWHAWYLAPLYWGFGAQYFNAGGTRLMLDTPEGLEALGFVERGLKAHELSNDDFPSGKAVMSDVGPFNTAIWRSRNPDLKVGIQTYPAGPGGPATDLAMWGYGVATTSQHPAEAMKFIKFATGEGYLQTFVDHGTAMPLTFSGYRSAQWNHLAQSVFKENAETWVRATSTGRAVNFGPNTNQAMTQIIGPEWSKFTSGQESAATFVAGVTPAVNALLATGKSRLVK